MSEIIHKGRNIHRLETNKREAVFAKTWEEENKDEDPFVAGVLAWLLHADDPSDHSEGTQREATIAATVIQWLGSSCGWAFLEKCVKECGYKIVPDRASMTGGEA